MPTLGSVRTTDRLIIAPRTWDAIPARLRDRGLRWTPQRRVLVEVLALADGHVTGPELVERCRQRDPGTIPSTVNLFGRCARCRSADPA